ncbi:hypothetical protein STRDD11_01479 [Streptococcus sp. DD11]|nr:hypothetical protein STRDD11_01479 [Streptococcus sp. DD11]
MESKRRTKSPISYRVKSFLPKQSETEGLLSQFLFFLLPVKERQQNRLS